MRKAPQLQEITKELNKQTQSPEAEQERSEKFMLKDMQAPVSIKSQSPTQMQTEKSDTEEEKEKQTLKIKTSIIDYEPSLSDEFQPLSRVISYYNKMFTLVKVKKTNVFICLLLLLLQLQ